MAKNDDPVTLEMTWGAAQAAARKHNCTIQELSNRQVKEMMPHGSDGCVNAFFRQVRIQDLDAQTYDLNVFSPAFKAGIVAEIRRFVDNGVKVAREEARITEEMFDQSCQDLDAAQETIGKLRNELATCNAQRAEENRRLELDLAAARERLAASEEVKSTLAKVYEEASHLKVRLAEVSNDLTAERSKASALQQRLAESEREREASAQKAALAEQQSEHAEASAGEQKSRVQELRDELAQAKAERKELQDKVSVLLERLGQAETRAAVAIAQSRATMAEEFLSESESAPRGAVEGNGSSAPCTRSDKKGRRSNSGDGKATS